MNRKLRNNHIKSILVITFTTFISFLNSANSQPVNKPVKSDIRISNNNFSELIMQIGFDEGDAYITVPENNVTSRHIGRLRKYDIHISKMFEVTAFMCNQGMVSPGMDWHYSAAKGNIDMGTFRISCNLANTIANTYKIRSTKLTAIKFYQPEGYPHETRKYRIGVLDIESDSNRTTSWLRFVQKFKPIKQ